MKYVNLVLTSFWKRRVSLIPVLMCWQVIKQDPSLSDSWRISWYFLETVIAVNTREEVNLILLVVTLKFISLSGNILNLRYSSRFYIPLTNEPSMLALHELSALITRFPISSFIFFLICISVSERESHSSNLINSTFNFSQGSIDSDGYCKDRSHSGIEVYNKRELGLYLQSWLPPRNHSQMIHS